MSKLRIPQGRQAAWDKSYRSMCVDLPKTRSSDPAVYDAKLGFWRDLLAENFAGVSFTVEEAAARLSKVPGPGEVAVVPLTVLRRVVGELAGSGEAVPAAAAAAAVEQLRSRPSVVGSIARGVRGVAGLVGSLVGIGRGAAEPRYVEEGAADRYVLVAPLEQRARAVHELVSQARELNNPVRAVLSLDDIRNEDLLPAETAARDVDLVLSALTRLRLAAAVPDSDPPAYVFVQHPASDAELAELAENSKAAAKLRAVAVSMERQVEDLEDRVSAEMEAVRRLVREGNKQRALFQLRRKKLLEKRLEERRAVLQNLLDVMLSLESAHNNRVMFDAMETARDGLERARSSLDADSIDDLMVDIEQLTQDVDVAAGALAQPMANAASVDDDEIALELEALDAEEIAAEVDEAQAPPIQLPEVPATPLRGYEPAAEVEPAEDRPPEALLQ